MTTTEEFIARGYTPAAAKQQIYEIAMREQALTRKDAEMKNRQKEQARNILSPSEFKQRYREE